MGDRRLLRLSGSVCNFLRPLPGVRPLCFTTVGYRRQSKRRGRSAGLYFGRVGLGRICLQGVVHRLQKVADSTTSYLLQADSTASLDVDTQDVGTIADGYSATSWTNKRALFDDASSYEDFSPPLSRQQDLARDYTHLDSEYYRALDHIRI